MTNYGPDKILDLYTSFERSIYKLSENHKNFDIRSMILKLWLLKDVQLQPPSFNHWFRDSFQTGILCIQFLKA